VEDAWKNLLALSKPPTGQTGTILRASLAFGTSKPQRTR
jgi:hypothetical protein